MLFYYLKYCKDYKKGCSNATFSSVFCTLSLLEFIKITNLKINLYKNHHYLRK